jgi:CRISPR-associated protein Csd2
MATLQNKIDFAVVFVVERANPNGDPLNGNRPRTDYSGLGEITDVCLKRKIRDRLQEAGYAIFVQSDDRKKDGARSLRERAESSEWGLGPSAFVFKSSKKKAPKKGQADRAPKDASAEIGQETAQKESTALMACKKWIDIRTFGNLFAWEGNQDADGVSIGIRGPVSITSAFSVQPVEVTSTQITKSVSGEGDGTKRGPDTMGMKHRVDKGVYVFYGSMNPQLAERTLFSDEDSRAIKVLLQRIFENDASSARPEGSMQVLKVIWWQHKPGLAGQYSSAKVHRSLTVNADGSIDLKKLDGLDPEVIDGF